MIRREKIILTLIAGLVIIVASFLVYGLTSGKLQSWADQIIGQQGATYYVSPNGNDANSGTLAKPWKTLQYAVNKLKAGDTLYLKEGTYYTPDIGLTITNSGISSARIVIAGNPGEKAIINNNLTKYPIVFRGNYITFRNLEVDQTPKAYSAIATYASHLVFDHITFKNAFCNYLQLKTPTNDVLISNNDFYGNTVNFPGYGSCDPNKIDNRVSNVIIEKNRFYRSAALNNIETGGDIILKGAPKNTVIRYNTFTSVGNQARGGAAIYVGGIIEGVTNLSEETLIHDNQIYNWETPFIWANKSKNLSVYNNVYVQSANNHFKCALILTSSAQYTKIINNIIYGDGIKELDNQCGAGLLSVGYLDNKIPTGLKIDNNLWYSPGDNYYITWGFGKMLFEQYQNVSGLESHSIIRKDPKFTDINNGDFHLQVASPAINAGTTPPQNWPDFDGTSRPQGSQVDIGVFEYVIGSPSISSIQISNMTESSATISFTTLESTKATLDYGTSLTYGSQLISPTASTHSFNLSGLTQATTYHFRIIVTNSKDIQSRTSDRSFTTKISPPNPVISNVQVTGLSQTQAQISFTANTPTKAKLDYGTTQNYGSQLTDTNLATSHTFNLSNLVKDTTYYYQLTATNSVDASTVYPNSFKTLSDQQPSIQEGDLIQPQGSSKIYLIYSNQKHHIPTPSVMFHTGYKTSQVKSISQAQADQIPTGKSLTSLWRSIGGTNLYHLSYGERYLVLNSRILAKLGYTSKQISNLPKALVSQKPVNMPLYKLRRSTTSPKIYLIFKNYKRWIANHQTFINLGFKVSEVKTILPKSFKPYPTKTPPLKQLLRSSASRKVYYVKSGFKYWVTTTAKIYKLGFTRQDIVVVPPGLLDLYITGYAI